MIYLYHHLSKIFESLYYIIEEPIKIIRPFRASKLIMYGDTIFTVNRQLNWKQLIGITQTNKPQNRNCALVCVSTKKATYLYQENLEYSFTIWSSWLFFILHYCKHNAWKKSLVSDFHYLCEPIYKIVWIYVRNGVPYCEL